MNEKRTFGVLIAFKADKELREITMGEFINLLRREHNMDEKVLFTEIPNDLFDVNSEKRTLKFSYSLNEN